MKNPSYTIIRKQKADKVNALISECKMFFAFSNEQFAKNKCELDEGDKYLSLGAGCFMPKSLYQKWSDGNKAIDKWYKETIKKAKQPEQHILFELQNYECFYTMDIEDAFEVLKQYYTREQVQEVFQKHRETEMQF